MHTCKRILSPKKFCKYSACISMKCVTRCPTIYNYDTIYYTYKFALIIVSNEFVTSLHFTSPASSLQRKTGIKDHHHANTHTLITAQHSIHVCSPLELMILAILVTVMLLCSSFGYNLEISMDEVFVSIIQNEQLK